MATLESRVIELAQTIANDVTGIESLIGQLGDLDTTAKGSLVAALNEVNQAVQAATAGGLSIDDAAPSLTKVYSSNKTVAEIDARIQGVIDASPTALDTLKEFATALGDDPNFAATITARFATVLRFDQAQTLTEEQQIQGAANLGLGDVLGTDFAAAYLTARS